MDSVKGASLVEMATLQGLVFRRAREAPPQLVGIALLRHALARLAFDPHRKPERLGTGRSELQMTRDELARVLHVALSVSDLAELQERGRIIGIELEGAHEKVFGFLAILHALATDARRGVRAPRRGVERIADGLQEVADRLLLAAAVAEEPAIGMVDLRVVRRKAQRTLEALLGLDRLLQLRIDQAVHVVRRRVIVVGCRGETQLLEGHPHVAAIGVRGSELRVHASPVARVADVADHRPGIRRLGVGSAARQQKQCGEGGARVHARTSFNRYRAWRRVRSATSPASWPQAAAISSPRVLRVVTVRPARCTISANRRMRSGEERPNPDAGNGLKGMRLNLQRTRFASSTSSCAWSSESLTPSSITYSIVMKSRGAFSK